MPGKETDGDDFPTPYDHFLYLLFELERAVERKGIDWSATNARLIQGRLLKLAEKVARAAGSGDGGIVH